jgi:hypothetical protein
MSKRKPRSASNLPRCYLYKIRGCRFAYGFFWYAVIVEEGEPPIGMYQERCARFMVRHFQPYVVVQPVTRRRSVESCVLYTLAAKRMGTISHTCHADALDTSRRDRSRSRRPSAVFPAAQTAMGSLRAPHLPRVGGAKTASTWIASGGGRGREGAVG